jgi:hypothetical protein
MSMKISDLHARTWLQRSTTGLKLAIGGWDGKPSRDEVACSTERSRNVIDNKALLFLEFEESRNVYENTTTYVQKAGMSIINKAVISL